MLTIKTWVNKQVQKIVHNRLPKGRKVNCNYTDDGKKKRRNNRWIQVQTAFTSTDDIHYEYINGHWELHLEPRNEKDKFSRISRFLRENTENPDVEWSSDGMRAIWKMEINSYEDLEKGLMELFGTFDNRLEECSERFKPNDLSSPYTISSEELKSFANENDEVCLKSIKICDLFDFHLTIPPYQRVYCWRDKEIQTLWDSLRDMPDHLDYHLGAIIIHNNNNCCDIIDGQQRLVTLTIILRALGHDGNMPLLKQQFKSIEARKNIANAKYVINKLKGWDVDGNKQLLDKIRKHLIFSVLVINSDNIDLAYTFFSNQNSKGVKLTDYDILKAHHLRFLITNESQSEHLARRWNALLQDVETDDEIVLHKTLGLHLFRMRKWMRNQSCDRLDSTRPVKDEYSAAPVIPGIPPFGEKFYFYEKIQGGAHFFAYTDRYVDLYKQFKATPQVSLLRKFLCGESHWKYESVIETVLFAYFSKFGKQYLSEALFCVTGVLAQHRYDKEKAIQKKINEYVQDKELIMMIDQASSPTFFLAESLSLIKISGQDIGGNGIKVRFYYALRKIFNELTNSNRYSNEDDFRLANFTDTYIEKKKNAEYE